MLSQPWHLYQCGPSKSNTFYLPQGRDHMHNVRIISLQIKHISPTPAGRWSTTLNTVCSPPAGNKDLGLEYILLTKGQWVGGLQIELSLSTFSLPWWHVTYHREESRQSYLSQHFLLTTVTHQLPQGGQQTLSPYHSDTSLTTGRTADTFSLPQWHVSLPQWHVTYHREDSRHFLLTTVTHHLPQGGQQTLSPYHSDTSLTTGGGEGAAIFLTPAHGVDVGWGDVAPVVIHVLPAIKVHQDLVTQDVRHSGHADQDRVLAIHRLQLHAHTKGAGGHRLLKMGNSRS